MTAQPALGDRRRWIALYVLCIGMLMIVLDVTVVNVALPSIQNDLHFSPSSLAWVVNAYLISFGGFLLLAGRLGDLTSRRNVFLIGLAVFTTASARFTYNLSALTPVTTENRGRAPECVSPTSAPAPNAPSAPPPDNARIRSGSENRRS